MNKILVILLMVFGVALSTPFSNCVCFRFPCSCDRPFKEPIEMLRRNLLEMVNNQKRNKALRVKFIIIN